MKSRMFAVFSLGALAATISMGAVQFASASGGKTITACANKSTGAMRLITKGSCKKDERRLSWNQQGIQGPAGPQGAPGANASTASNNSGNGSIYDSAGAYIGQLVDVSDGIWYDEYKIARDGVYFHIGSDGGIYDQIYFDGPNCTGTAFVFTYETRQWPRQLSRSEAILALAPGSQTVRWYRPNSGELTLLTPASVMGEYFRTGGLDTYINQIDGVGSCTNLTGYTASLNRTVEPFTPPMVFTINSPLRMTP